MGKFANCDTWCDRHRQHTNMGMIQQIRQHKVRFLKTCVLYVTLTALGLSVGMVGPTLLDLKIALSASNVTLTQVSFVLPGRAGGYAVGSLIGESTMSTSLLTK